MIKLYDAEDIRKIKNFGLPYGFDKESGEYFFPELCISATMRCNYKCKLCVVGCPRYKNPEHPSVEALIEWMDKYFEIVDFTLKLAVSGGEPLVRNDLDVFFEYLIRYKSIFGRVRINTNGTLVPSDKLCEALSKFGRQAEVLIDNYYFSSNAENIAKKLDSYGILNIVRDYKNTGSYWFNGWVNYGNFDKEVPVNKDCNCRHFAAYLRDGRIWMCPSQLLYEDFSPHDDNFIRGVEAIDLYDNTKSIAEKREELSRYWSQDYWESCKWCLGRDENSERFPPAEQL